VRDFGGVRRWGWPTPRALGNTRDAGGVADDVHPQAFEKTRNRRAAGARLFNTPRRVCAAFMRLRAPLCTAVLLACAPALCQVTAALSDPAVLAAGSPTAVTVVPAAPVSAPVRLSLETGAGLLGGAAVGVFSEWAFSGLLGTQNNTTQTQRFTSLFGAPLGVAVGAPLAVSLTGYTLNEHGSFLVSWLSSMAGLAVGGSLYLTVNGLSSSQAAKATYALPLLLPVVGAVLGYELSARAADTPRPQGPAIVPSLFLSPGGGGGAVAGRF
jgi:hypothetical protein